MLDPLGVALGGFGVEAQAQQEPQHDLVPPTALPGQRAALVGEEHGPIPRPGDQALPGQTVERLGHRRDPDAKPRGDIHRPRLAVVVDQFGDQFDIVLGQLGGTMASPMRSFLTNLRAPLQNFGLLLNQLKSKKEE